MKGLSYIIQTIINYINLKKLLKGNIVTDKTRQPQKSQQQQHYLWIIYKYIYIYLCMKIMQFIILCVFIKIKFK